MDLAGVMDELGAALEDISGLRVFPWWADRITPPAAIVEFPEELTFDGTHGRGSDRMTVPLVVAVAKNDARTARNALAAYCNGSGAASVKAVLEAATYTACDSVRVQSCEFGVVTVAAVEYLAATFSIDVIGQGGA